MRSCLRFETAQLEPLKGPAQEDKQRRALFASLCNVHGADRGTQNGTFPELQKSLVLGLACVETWPYKAEGPKKQELPSEEACWAEH